jgi:hypothetical protein
VGYSIPTFLNDSYNGDIFTNGVIGIPVGVHFIEKRGFSFSVEGVLAMMYYKVYTFPDKFVPLADTG